MLDHLVIHAVSHRKVTKDGCPYLYDSDIPAKVLYAIELHVWRIAEDFVGNNIAAEVEGDLFRKIFRQRKFDCNLVESAYHRFETI